MNRDHLARHTLLLLFALVALLIGTASPASAHATLISSDPAEGAVLETQPEQIRFTFSESVSLVPDGVQVFDARGGSVASSATARGPELTAELPDEVGEGTLVVVWRVVSEDGHPISGSLRFSVGAPSAEVAAPPVETAVPAKPPWTLSVTEWVGYVGLLMAAGMVAFTVLFLPASHLANKSRRRLVVAARGGAVAAVLAWLLGVPLTAMYQLGGGLGVLAERTTWSTLAVMEYVTAGVVAGGVVASVVLLGDGVNGVRQNVAAMVAGAAALSAPALTGHTRAVTPEVLVVGADMLHLLTGSVWLGGLLALLLVLPDLAGRGTLAVETLARFSVVAAGVLVALVLTGSLLAWRITGSWAVLFDSAYGRLLLVKVAAALVAVLIAAANRFVLLPRLQQATHRRDRRAGAGLLVRATAAETAVLVGVLLVTGFLVDKSPERDRAEPAAATPAEPVTKTASLGDIEVRATMASPVPGPSAITVELLDANGEPTEGLKAPSIRLASDKVNLGTLPAQSVAPGTYEAQAVLPTPGSWRLQVSLRVGEFDNPVATLEFTVGQN
ncbi:copper resistance protein CopC [Nocardioides speluncae]|uniref:copper resistance CopC/CopD family protein n=1 Tax=Nocardioides speluncae TaxID=2670337 RepID=UPI001F0CC317|nr:copper resistance protein CopC [Nocardioides speluncae]